MRFLSILVDFLVQKIKSSMAAKISGVMLTILKNYDIGVWILVFDPAVLIKI